MNQILQSQKNSGLTYFYLQHLNALGNEVVSTWKHHLRALNKATICQGLRYVSNYFLQVLLYSSPGKESISISPVQKGSCFQHQWAGEEHSQTPFYNGIATWHPTTGAEQEAFQNNQKREPCHRCLRVSQPRAYIHCIPAFRLGRSYRRRLRLRYLW